MMEDDNNNKKGGDCEYLHLGDVSDKLFAILNPLVGLMYQMMRDNLQ